VLEDVDVETLGRLDDPFTGRPQVDFITSWSILFPALLWCFLFSKAPA